MASQWGPDPDPPRPPPSSPQPPSRKKGPGAFKAGFLGCFGVLAAAVVVIVVVAALVSSGSNPATTVATAPARAPDGVAVTAGKTKTPTTARPKPKPTATYGEGTYKVGTDILPGLYKATVTSGMGYWARLGDPDGDSIHANDVKSAGTMYLRVRSSDAYIQISGTTFTKVG